MKNILITLGGLSIVIVAGFWYQNSQQEIGWSRGETEVITEVVEINELDKRIEDAQEQARAEIETKAQAAYDETYSQEMEEVRLEVIKQYRAEIQQLETDVSKKVGEY